MGALGDRFYITRPRFWTLNTSLKKDVRIRERLLLTLQGEFLNVLNHPEFGAKHHPDSDHIRAGDEQPGRPAEHPASRIFALEGGQLLTQG